MPTHDSNRNLVAALSYFGLFITGVVILFVEKDDKYIRFHAMQSILIFGSWFVLNLIIGTVFSPIGIFGIIGHLIDTGLFILALVVWAVSMYKAFSGEVFKWPIFGAIAENQVK